MNNPKEIKEKFLTMRLPASILDQLKQQADKNTRTISAQAMHYIKIGLAEKK